MNARSSFRWAAFALAAVNFYAVPATSPAQSAPAFAPSQVLSNRELLLKLDAPAGAYCRMDTSTNLTHWDGFVTLLSTGLNLHVDSAAPFLNQRFYRAQEPADTNLVTGDHLPTARGEVVIHPVFHASFAMTWDGKTIYVDPTNRFGGVPRADLILVTHEHGDHFSQSAISNVMNTPVLIVAPPRVWTNLSTYLRSVTARLANGDTTNLLDIGIEAVPAYNTNTTGTVNHPRGNGNGYVLTMGGQRLYVSGDTHNTPEMCQLTNIDVAFLAMNTPYTMNLTQALLAARCFRPRVIYPVHYRNQDLTFTDVPSFKRQLLADPGLEVRLRKWY